jgi:hypothetical protein
MHELTPYALVTTCNSGFLIPKVNARGHYHGALPLVMLTMVHSSATFIQKDVMAITKKRFLPPRNMAGIRPVARLAQNEERGCTGP